MQWLHNSKSSVHPTSRKETIVNARNILTSKIIHKLEISHSLSKEFKTDNV